MRSATLSLPRTPPNIPVPIFDASVDVERAIRKIDQKYSTLDAYGVKLLVVEATQEKKTSLNDSGAQ